MFGFSANEDVHSTSLQILNTYKTNYSRAKNKKKRKTMSKKNSKTPPSVSPSKQATKSTPTPVATASESLGFWHNTRLQAIALFAVSFLLYANTLFHDYCQDDAIVITENMFTTKGVSGIGGILSYDTFYGFFKEQGKAQLVAGGRYRPFTLVMFAIEYQIFGKNPFIGHFLNVVLFGLTSVLLYFLLLRLLKGGDGQQATGDSVGRVTHPILVAFGAALLFAVHPIHTEAVANIKGRDEIMTLLGSLAAVWFALDFYEGKGVKSLIWAVISFFIAIMSKENAVTFVVIVPLIFYFFYHTNWATAFRQTIPFLVTTILFLLLRGVAIGNQFGGEQLELMNNPFLKLVGNQYVAFDFSEKFATITYTLGKYIALLFAPYALTHDYYPRHVDIMQFSNPSVLLSLVTYAVLVYFLLRGVSRRDVVSFGIAFFLLTTSIVSNIVFPVGTNMAERFMFMPSVGFCLVVAVLVERLLTNKPALKTAILGVSALFLTAFSFKTIDRNAAWKDNYTIFTTDIEISQNSAKLNNSVGGETIERYKTSTNPTELAEKMRYAITRLQKAVTLHPTYKNPYLLMGNAHFYLKEYDKSIAAYEQALKLDPAYADALNNRQMVYREGGKTIAQEQNDLNKAVLMLNKAVELNPNDAQAFSYLGTVYGISGNPTACAEALKRALAIRFDKSDAVNLSVAYRQLGNIAEALAWEQKAK
jgi:protein O-mannosyl-transferase